MPCHYTYTVISRCSEIDFVGPYRQVISLEAQYLRLTELFDITFLQIKTLPLPNCKRFITYLRVWKACPLWEKRMDVEAQCAANCPTGVKPIWIVIYPHGGIVTEFCSKQAAQKEAVLCGGIYYLLGDPTVLTA
jgi:hypothetical protein